MPRYRGWLWPEAPGRLPPDRDLQGLPLHAPRCLMKKHDAREIGLIVVHHTASNPFRTDWKSVRRWHQARFKLGIGYHRLIEHDGFVMDGRRIQRRGAHSPPNAGTLGIVVLGWNGNLDHPNWAWSRAQWDSLFSELLYWCDRLPLALICGHNQRSATLCPGFSLPPELRKRGFPKMDRVVTGRSA